jgi:hypothetical protein
LTGSLDRQANDTDLDPLSIGDGSAAHSEFDLRGETRPHPLPALSNDMLDGVLGNPFVTTFDLPQKSFSSVVFPFPISFANGWPATYKTPPSFISLVELSFAPTDASTRPIKAHRTHAAPRSVRNYRAIDHKTRFGHVPPTDVAGFDFSTPIRRFRNIILAL